MSRAWAPHEQLLDQRCCVDDLLRNAETSPGWRNHRATVREMVEVDTDTSTAFFADCMLATGWGQEKHRTQPRVSLFEDAKCLFLAAGLRLAEHRGVELHIQNPLSDFEDLRCVTDPFGGPSVHYVSARGVRAFPMHLPVDALPRAVQKRKKSQTVQQERERGNYERVCSLLAQCDCGPSRRAYEVMSSCVVSNGADGDVRMWMPLASKPVPCGWDGSEGGDGMPNPDALQMNEQHAVLEWGVRCFRFELLGAYGDLVLRKPKHSASELCVGAIATVREGGRRGSTQKRAYVGLVAKRGAAWVVADADCSSPLRVYTVEGRALCACKNKDASMQALDRLLNIRERRALQSHMSETTTEEQRRFFENARTRLNLHHKALYETFAIWSHPTKSQRNKKLSIALPNVLVRTMHSDRAAVLPMGLAFMGVRITRCESARKDADVSVGALSPCDVLDACELRVLHRAQLRRNPGDAPLAASCDIDDFGTAHFSRRGDGSRRKTTENLFIERSGMTTEIDLEVVRVVAIPPEIAHRYAWPFVGALTLQVRARIRSAHASTRNRELESMFGSAYLNTAEMVVAAFAKRYLGPRLGHAHHLVDRVLRHYVPGVPWHEWRSSPRRAPDDGVPGPSRQADGLSEEEEEEEEGGADGGDEELRIFNSIALRYAKEEMATGTPAGDVCLFDEEDELDTIFTDMGFESFSRDL